MGPPAHTNDYDEIWFLHTGGRPGREDRVGLLRWEPQGATQPGFVRPNGNGANGNGAAPAGPRPGRR